MGILDVVGNTPLVRLRALPREGSAEVWVKWEGSNPTGSMKDRMAKNMIHAAEERGELRPGMTVIEVTGGSTGSSLALVCALKGYRAHFVSSDAFALEKLSTIRAFGAELELLPSHDGRITATVRTAMQARVEELATRPANFWTRQFSNPDNRSAYHAMAHELLRDLHGRVDAFVMGVGTGGCISGNAEILKEHKPDMRCIAVEPATAQLLSGGVNTGHGIEGLASAYITSITRTDLIDEVISVTDDDALATSRRLAREEGIFSGISAGAHVWAALQIAQRLGSGQRVVTVAPDTGLKYLQGRLFRWSA